MLANTLSLTIGAKPAVTLTRSREDGGQSVYIYRSAGVNITLKIRQNTQKSGGNLFNVYNMSLEHVVADTLTELGHTTTASFTGRLESLTDPLFSADLTAGLFNMAEPIMASLAGGEL